MCVLPLNSFWEFILGVLSRNVVWEWFLGFFLCVCVCLFFLSVLSYQMILLAKHFVLITLHPAIPLDEQYNAHNINTKKNEQKTAPHTHTLTHKTCTFASAGETGAGPLLNERWENPAEVPRAGNPINCCMMCKQRLQNGTHCAYERSTWQTRTPH